MKIIKLDYTTIYLLLIYFLCGYIRIGIMILFIVFMHEVGHVIVSKIFKYKVISVVIYPFGGITKIQKDINTSTNKEIILAISGILMQIILGLLVKLINIHDYQLFYKINTSIMFFNLLPIIPLDGSIILKSILNKFFSFKISLKIYIIISIICIFIYVFFNYKYNINNYLIIGLFIYKIYKEIKEYKYIYNKFLLERFLHDYKFKYISTRKGNLDILKLDTYQYFKDGSSILSEKELLKRRFKGIM